MLAHEYRLTRGYRLRVDSSATESNIHYPTDSSLLVDGVWVLGRWLKHFASAVAVCTQTLHGFSDKNQLLGAMPRDVAELSRA